ncbi:MAG: hypothetical protein N2506_00335 [Dehalococcoidales bacterium]|nr:hypothetical protein [Dehalococcoidales bacterium]
MKKVIFVAAAIMLGIIILGGCSADSLVKAGFKKASDGSYTYLDTKTSPLPEGGLKIALVPGTEGYVKFIVTDAEGKETADYYKFTPARSEVLRYHYVSAMGTAFNYYFDYAAMQLLKVTDASNKDVTDSLKRMGRWDAAASETGEHVRKLVDYFRSRFGMEINEAVRR